MKSVISHLRSLPLLLCILLIIPAISVPLLTDWSDHSISTVESIDEKIRNAGTIGGKQWSSRAANKVLVCSSGGDRTNTLQNHLTNRGIPFDVEQPGVTAQHNSEYLFDRYYAIYTGCQGDIADGSLKTMMNGGIIEKYVKKGGIFVANAAHNSGQDVTGPGGSNFGSYQQSGNTDENPTVADNDHEWITGQGYGGNGLNANNFQGWGTTCHGYVTAPGMLADSGGANLGTNPETNKWNDILWSNANNKPAFIEYVLDEGYVMMNMMTFDWGNRGNNELLQMVKYIDMIKDNFPTARPPEPESVNLIDSDNKSAVCYAGYRSYKLGINVTTFESLDDLSDLRIYIDYNNTNISLGFNGTQKNFYKVHDLGNHLELLGDSAFSNNNVEKWWINFSFVLDFTFPHEELIDCFINTTGSSGRFNLDRFPYLFRVENDLELVGETVVEGEYQGIVDRGNWIRGKEKLIFSNMTVVYEGSGNVHPDDNFFDVVVRDRMANEWWDNESSGKSVSIEAISGNATDPEEEYQISIVNIPEEGVCAKNLYFPLKIDAAAPLSPVNLQCRPDSFKGKSAEHTNKQEVFVTWDEVEDPASGLRGYYYSLMDNSTTENGSFTNETEVEINELPEGPVPVYVWCVDNVGNVGGAAASEILVDLSLPYFSNYTPLDGSWHNHTDVDCSVDIHDGKGGGVDGATIEYSVSKNGVHGFDLWIPVWMPEKTEPMTPVVKYVFLEGENNYLKWRAKDISGNGFVESSPVNIKIDNTPVNFAQTISPQEEWYLQKTITTKITVNDAGSGMDPESLEMRISTSGPTDFRSWMSIEPENIIKSGEDGFEISVTFTYAEGTENYIMFRGTDIVGNPFTLSDKFNLKIDTSPVYFGTFTPEENEYSNQQTVECFVEILDDGSGVDPGTVEYSMASGAGGDNDSFRPWKKVVNVVIGNPTQVLLELEFDWGPDNFIRWRADDKVGTGHNISKPYRVWVNSRPEAVISSPDQASYFRFDREIYFDATDSYDEDGDNLSYYWSSNVSANKSMSHLALFGSRLTPGKHIITLFVFDGHGYNESTDVRIEVGSKTDYETDSDGDGFSDGFERESGTDPYNGAVIPEGEPDIVPAESAGILGESSSLLLIILGCILLLILLILIIFFIVRKKRKSKEEKVAAPVPSFPRQPPYGQGPHSAQYAPLVQGYGGVMPAPMAGMPGSPAPPLMLAPGPGFVNPVQFQAAAPGQALTGAAALNTGYAGGSSYLLPTFSTDQGMQELGRLALPPAPEPSPAPVVFTGLEFPIQASVAPLGPDIGSPMPIADTTNISPVDNTLPSSPAPPIPPNAMEAAPPSISPPLMPPTGVEAVFPLPLPTPSMIPEVPAVPPEGSGDLSELDSYLAYLEDMTKPPEPAPPVASPTAPPAIPPAIPSVPEGAPAPVTNEITMQCHSCGNNYSAEIVELPALVACPVCQTQGMIESL